MWPTIAVVPFLLFAALIDPERSPASVLSRTPTSFGHVQVDAADVAAAIVEGEAAHVTARTVLGLADVRFDIVEAQDSPRRFGERSSEGVPTYVWPFRQSADGRSQPPPAYLLRHEIGHDLFIRYLVPSTGSSQYGGDAPDWLDEMAAIAFEGEPLRSLRRRSIVHVAQEGKLIPLHRFLNMVHPEMAAGSIPDTDGRLGAAFDPASDETASFYAMAAAFYEFLVARTENAAIIADLAAVVRRGEPVEPWLLARTGYADAARGIDALDRDFQNWIASGAGYGGPSGQRATRTNEPCSR
ncbi:MAG: hypothetical protein KF780_00030 [Sphingomonas sp.]|nr:hypothetical protein [Sphingomonas sp.]